jgi:type I restriction enzyme S subunit
VKSPPHRPIGELVERVQTWDPTREAEGSEFVYVDLSAVDQDTKRITGTKRLQCNDAPSRARQLVNAGDVLVSTVRPNLNGVALVTDELQGATASTGFCVLRAATQFLDRNYLFHWVKSPNFIAEMTRLATGASYPAVSDRIIHESRIPLPPVAEQKRIASILDHADALRALRRSALAKLDALPQAIFADMFERGNSVPVSTLGEVAQLKRGPFGGALKKEIFVADGYKVYEQRNAIQADFQIGRYFIDEAKFASMKEFSLQPMDLIVSCSGTLGRVAIVPLGAKPGVINQALLRVRVKQGVVTPLFLKHALESTVRQNELAGLSHGTGLQNFPPMSSVKSLSMPLPPLALQEEFARRVGALEQLRSAHRDALRKLDELFAALQHRAFRGEL